MGLHRIRCRKFDESVRKFVRHAQPLSEQSQLAPPREAVPAPARFAMLTLRRKHMATSLALASRTPQSKPRRP